MIITKSFKDNVIEIREDGFFSATAMCKAFNKVPKDYLRLDSTKAFMKALESDRLICPSPAVYIRKGNSFTEQGTWVHRLVAIDLARWLSPEFHVQVITWADEILRGVTPSLHKPSSEDYYVAQLVDLFSRTDKPLQKEIILANTVSDTPPTRRIDLKVCGEAIYYEVKMHRITMTDLKEIFFERRYPDLLFNLHRTNYTLYLVSPKGINEEAKCFISLMKNVQFIHGEHLALQAASSLMTQLEARQQLLRHVLPSYSHLLPDNWKTALKLSEPAPSLSLKPQPISLIYKKDLPLGVVFCKGRGLKAKRYRGSFSHSKKKYECGYFHTAEEAGASVRDKMLEIKGTYKL